MTHAEFENEPFSQNLHRKLLGRDYAWVGKMHEIGKLLYAGREHSSFMRCFKRDARNLKQIGADAFFTNVQTYYDHYNLGG